MITLLYIHISIYIDAYIHDTIQRKPNDVLNWFFISLGIVISRLGDGDGKTCVFV